MHRDAALRTHLAIPRVTGSPAHAKTRECLIAHFEERGWTVERHAFAAPATRIWLPQAAAAVLAIAALAATALGLGSARIAGAGVALAALAAFLSRHLVRLERVLGRRGENLIATRPGVPPRVWLVAHYDTKGQRLSMAGRLLAAILALTGTLALVVAGSAAALNHTPGPVAWLFAAALALAGALPLATIGLRNESPGAVDNGSGVLAALATAVALPPGAPVGVLLTDAEELGLLGARALACERPALLDAAAVINFDGIDDRGTTLALVHRPGPIVDAVAAALGRRWRWLPVIVDGLVLAPPAREAVTILRGDWATMRVVHTARDTAERLTYRGAEAVAQRVAEVLQALNPGVLSGG